MYQLNSTANGLDWHCYLAGSSKTAPRILIFSIAMVADYLFDVKNIDIWVPVFLKHNNLSIVTVKRKPPTPFYIITYLTAILLSTSYMYKPKMCYISEQFLKKYEIYI